MNKPKLSIAGIPKADDAALALRAALKPVRKALAALPANDDSAEDGDDAFAMQCAISRMFF